MKKSVILLIFIACYSCISCTSDHNDEFRSPDLALFVLKGKVKECQIYHFKAIDDNGSVLKGDSLGMYFNDILKYSDKGEIIFISGYGSLTGKEVTVKRNRSGRIIELYSESEVSEEEGGGTYVQGQTWEYDSHGRPCRTNRYDDVEGNFSDERIEYDDKNNISKTEDKGRFPRVDTYQYIEFDKHCNWVKRVVISEELLMEPEKRYEERIISYYK